MAQFSSSARCIARLLAVSLSIASTAVGARANEMSVVFDVPATWTQAPKPDGHPEVLGIWYAPHVAASGFRESINVVRLPLDSTLKAFIVASLDNYQIRSPLLHFVSRKANENCASGTSEIIEEMDTYANGVKISATQVFTKSGANVFITTYAHAASDTSNPAAIETVTKTCAAES